MTTFTPILNLQEISPSQNQKEATANDAFVGLENATQAATTVDLSTGNAATLTLDDFVGSFSFACSGHTGAAILTLPTPLIPRCFYVYNAEAFIVTVDGGGVTADVAPTSGTVIISDGTDCFTSTSAPPPSGAVTSLADSGLVHVSAATGAVTISLDDIASGSLIGNTGTAAAAPAEITLDDILDFNIGAVEGTMLVRGPSGWIALDPGTDGDVLTTHGTAAVPTWETSAGGGGSWLAGTVAAISSNFTIVSGDTLDLADDIDIAGTVSAALGVFTNTGTTDPTVTMVQIGAEAPAQVIQFGSVYAAAPSGYVGIQLSGPDASGAPVRFLADSYSGSAPWFSGRRFGGSSGTIEAVDANSVVVSLNGIAHDGTTEAILGEFTLKTINDQDGSDHGSVWEWTGIPSGDTSIQVLGNWYGNGHFVINGTVDAGYFLDVIGDARFETLTVGTTDPITAFSDAFGIDGSGIVDIDAQGTITATTTATITPAAGTTSWLVNMGTVDTTLDIGNGLYAGQRQRVEVKQGATTHLLNLGTSIAVGSDITGFTASVVANKLDVLMFDWSAAISKWLLVAYARGY